MDASELKLKIFREIDSLEESKLQEVYGFLQNFVRGEKDLDEWNDLNTKQKQGILDAIEELNEGKGILHESVIAKYRKKYSDG
jgi:DNA phosphorothioation-dependent restriction protein DptG